MDENKKKKSLKEKVVDKANALFKANMEDMVLMAGGAAIGVFASGIGFAFGWHGGQKAMGDAIIEGIKGFQEGSGQI